MIKVKETKKLGVLTRAGASFIMVVTILGLIGICFVAIAEGIEPTFFMLSIAFQLAVLYITGFITVKGVPPKFLEWTR